MKEENPRLKVMISMANNFRVISTQSRVKFAENVKQFLDKYELDGVGEKVEVKNLKNTMQILIDIDWEWPAAQDREFYVLLLQDLRKAITNKKILTIAAAPCNNFASGYDIPLMLSEVDFFNVMLYNFHGGGWQNYTANHCNYWHPRSNYNLITCINYWISAGAPHEKIMIGVATHGRNYVLDNPELNGVGALATFKEFPGAIPTTFSYNIICKNIQENGWTRRYEKQSSSGPYAFKGTTWTGYDDLESIRQKSILVKKVNFGGMMFWSLDHDDHSDVCGDGKFPLIKSVWEIIM